MTDSTVRRLQRVGLLIFLGLLLVVIVLVGR